MKKILTPKNILIFSILIFLFSIIITLFQFFETPVSASYLVTTTPLKTHYVLRILQCLVGLISTGMLYHVDQHTKIKIPACLMITTCLFLFCGIYLGEVWDFYYRFVFWDTFLHLFSGTLLGLLGFSFLNFFDEKKTFYLTNPFLIALFALCFASFLGILWEIYEFLADFILNTNMQKFAFENGQLLLGKAALSDTMKDFIANTLGSLCSAIFGYFSKKYHKNWLEPFYIKIK